MVFGAAVWPGGKPSPALARRIALAANAARRDPRAEVLCSGGIGRHGPSEAAVMAEELRGIIGMHRVHLDERSRDTVDSVRTAAQFARTHGFTTCIACTHRYHQARVRMLFAMFGVRARSLSLTSSARTQRRLRARMWLREAAALPYDLAAATGRALAARRQARGIRRAIQRRR